MPNDQQTWDEVISSVSFNKDIPITPKPPMPMVKKRPKTLKDAMDIYGLLPRERTRLAEAVPDEDTYRMLSVRSFYYLAVACRDPQANCQGVTLSKKIMFYGKLNRSWESIAAAVKMLQRDFNGIIVDVKPFEPVHQFRVRLLGAIYQLVK